MNEKTYWNYLDKVIAHESVEHPILSVVVIGNKLQFNCPFGNSSRYFSLRRRYQEEIGEPIDLPLEIRGIYNFHLHGKVEKSKIEQEFKKLGYTVEFL